MLSIVLLIYKFIFPKKKINLFVLLILISILPIISIFRSGTYQSADLTLHSVLLQSFFSNLSQGNLIPQWAGEICGGYGCPAHLFEYPLPYYIGSIFHIMGFDYLNSIKLLLAFSFITSGIGMFLWLKKEFGEIPAFVGSLFYLFAPYHLEDLHFRASVGEVLSFATLPFVFLFIKSSMSSKNPINFILLSISTALLILSHGNTLMSAGPLAFLYFVFLISSSKEKTKDLLFIGSSVFFGFLLTAFYWIPIFFEIKYTWYTLSQFHITDFKPIIEHVISPIRSGFLFQGHNGELRLIIGYFHLIVLIYSIYLLYKKRVSDSHKKLLYLMIFSSLFYFFMLLEISRPVWEFLPFFDSFTFPWRLLLPISLATSLITAIVISNVKNMKIIFLLSFLVIATTILNWGNRQMVQEDKNAFYSHIWGYSEYFIPNNPKYLKTYKERQANEANIVRNRTNQYLKLISGNGEIKQLTRLNTYHKYLVNVSDKSTLLEKTNYFPGWLVLANGKKLTIDYENNKYFGKIVFTLPKGLYEIEVIFNDTNVRKYSKNISVLSSLILITVLLKEVFYFFQRPKYWLTKKSQEKRLTHK